MVCNLFAILNFNMLLCRRASQGDIRLLYTSSIILVLYDLDRGDTY